MKRLNMAGRMALLIAGIALLLTGCEGALKPEGKVAEDQFQLINLSFGIMAVVMAVVFAIFFYVIIRFRKRKGQTGYPKQVEGSHKLEIIWTVIPFCLILVLASFTVVMALDQDKPATAENAINVEVIAHQFWWEFYYPDYDIRTAQDLVLPTNRWVNAAITSSDVIHSFWIPQLAGKLDANPGLTKNLAFKTSEAPNVYLGKCAELCGQGHALMDFKTVVLSPEDFEAWVENMKTPAPAPTTAAAIAGEELFKSASCIQCHAITSDGISMGPNLKGFADRETVGAFRPNTDEWLAKWIRSPHDVKPGATMPDFPDLTDQQISDLVAYLRTLK